MPGKKASKKDQPRRRRTAEEARAEILDAAERRLRERGPDAIRLQEIAADIGISHPAILHHFGSREGLVAAVTERVMMNLEAELLATMLRGSETGQVPDAVEINERVSEMLGDKGQARLIAWLALTGHNMMRSPEARASWTLIVEATHALRLTRIKKKEKPSIEDTRFAVALSSMTLFGEALIGASVLESAGVTSGGNAAEDARARKRFRAWFAKLLERHLEDPP